MMLNAQQLAIIKITNREQAELMLAEVIRRESHECCTSYTLNVYAGGMDSHFTTTSRRFFEVQGLAPVNNLRNKPLPTITKAAS